MLSDNWQILGSETVITQSLGSSGFWGLGPIYGGYVGSIEYHRVLLGLVVCGLKGLSYSKDSRFRAQGLLLDFSRFQNFLLRGGPAHF